MTILVNLLSVTVRRDPMTITPVSVPEYEVPVLRNLFGKENVTVNEALHTIEMDPEAEYERLAAKYGPDVVSRIFGDDDGARLSELVLKAAVLEKTVTQLEKAPAKAKA